MISVISYDIDTVNQSIAEDLLQIVQSVLTVSASLVMMLTIEPLLVSVFAVTIPLSILLTRFITRRARPLFRARSAKLGELNGFVEEMLEGQKTTKAYDREEAVIRRFEQKNQQAVQAYTKAEYFGRMTGPSVNFINNVFSGINQCVRCADVSEGADRVGRYFFFYTIFTQILRTYQ